MMFSNCTHTHTYANVIDYAVFEPTYRKIEREREQNERWDVSSDPANVESNSVSITGANNKTKQYKMIHLVLPCS